MKARVITFLIVFSFFPLTFNLYIVFGGLLIAITNPCPAELYTFFMKIPALNQEQEEEEDI